MKTDFVDNLYIDRNLRLNSIDFVVLLNFWMETIHEEHSERFYWNRTWNSQLNAIDAKKKNFHGKNVRFISDKLFLNKKDLKRIHRILFVEWEKLTDWICGPDGNCLCFCLDWRNRSFLGIQVSSDVGSLVREFWLVRSMNLWIALLYW